ncbi:hypothetical protein AB4Z48_09605 [Cupriavidus sp. 2TAF22]|uniref:hypothetical protein n=1 Tax=unclassified Cupriavidus TaxID=2640874 RepID=UPI003F923F2B
MSEEALPADTLNIESLFQQALASLEAVEVEAIKAIAREASGIDYHLPGHSR